MKGWLNVCPKRKTSKDKLPAQAGGLYATKKEADKLAKPHRIASHACLWNGMNESELSDLPAGLLEQELPPCS